MKAGVCLLLLLLLWLAVIVAAGDSLRYHSSEGEISLHGDTLRATYGPGCGLPEVSLQNATGRAVLPGGLVVGLSGGDVSIKFVNMSFNNTTSYNTVIEIGGADMIDVRARSNISDIQTFCLGNFDLLLTTSAGRWSE